MDKKQRRLYTTTIYAVGFLQMGGVGISPVLDELSKAFPQYSTTAIQLTSSIVSLFVVLTNLITGWLCARFPKKYLTAFGCGLAVLFALLATIFNSSLPQLYLWASLLGIGTSIASTVSMAIVNEMFEPEECVSVFGIRACFSSVGAMLMTFIGGRWVGINWRYGFLVYLVMLPGLLLSLLWSPKDTKIAKSNASASNAPFSVKRPVFPCFVGFFVSMLYSTAMVNVAMLVAESDFVPAEQIASMAGTLSTVFLAIGGVTGLAVDKIAKKIGLHCMTLGFAGLLVGYLDIFFANSYAMLIVASLFCGGAITLVMPHAQVLSSEAGCTKQELGLSIGQIFANSGNVLAPLLTNLSMLLFGTAIVKYRFLTAAGLAFAVMMITAAHVQQQKKEEGI